MQDVELRLVANNAPAVKSVKELSDVTKKLYDYSTQGTGKLTGAINQEATVLKSLQKFKQGASAEDLKYYNQAIEQSKKRLSSYENEGTAVEKTGKSFSGLGAIFAKLGGTLALVTGAIKLIKDIIGSTEGTANKFKVTMAALHGAYHGFLRTIATGDWTELINNIVKTSKATKDLTNAQLEYMDLLASNTIKKGFTERSLAANKAAAAEAATDKLRKQYTEAAIVDQKALTAIIVEEKAKIITNTEDYFKTIDGYDETYYDQAIPRIRKMAGEYNIWFGKNSVMIEGMKARLNELDSIATTSVLTDAQKKEHKELRLTLLAYEDLIKLQSGTAPETFNEYKKAIGDFNSAVADGDVALIRLNKTATSVDKAAIEKANTEKLKLEDQYQTALNKLIDKYNASNIESKTGVDKLKAQRDFALDEITALKNDITKAMSAAGLGELTDMQNTMIETLRNNVQQAFLKGMEKEAKVTPEQKTAISKALLAGIPTADELKHNDIRTTPATHPISSIWELIGIDTSTDKGKQIVENFKTVINEVSGILNDYYNDQLEQATTNRENLDTKVSELEDELQTEEELYKDGYASNVAGKKAELAEVKKQRDLALIEEEKATKKKNRLETLEQISSLITASANIIKGWSTIPFVGQVLAVAAIAAMFTAFAVTKVKANATATTLAEGGHGEVSGKLHSQGGERFLDHIEVEQGEKWGVLSRQASRKYGNTFYKMVDSFNRDALSIPKQGVVNNILLDTSMTNDRLDQIIQLNKKEKKEEIIIMNGRTIYKKGSTIRTIKH
jgi:hypothetical protein